MVFFEPAIMGSLGQKVWRPTYSSQGKQAKLIREWGRGYFVSPFSLFLRTYRSPPHIGDMCKEITEYTLYPSTNLPLKG